MLVGTVDTNFFADVKENLGEKISDGHPVSKKDWIGHMQKRMAAAARMYKNTKHGLKLFNSKTNRNTWGQHSECTKARTVVSTTIGSKLEITHSIVESNQN